jgi:hypothetical protein
MPAKTEIFGRGQPGGLFVFTDEGRTTGDIFFVHSGTGTDGAGYGGNPNAPCATLDYAIGLCTASKGDRIYVMPGHAETIVGAAGVALDVAGVSVFGLGVGRNRPVFTFTTSTAASFDISAANCQVSGLVFVNGIDSQTAMVNVTAAGVTVKDCEFDVANASTQAVLGVLTNASASRFTLANCHIHGTTDAGTATAVRIVGGSDIIVRDNRIYGAYTTSLGGIENVTTAVAGLTIEGNFVANQTASSTKAIVVVSTTNAFIHNNRVVILSGTAPITAAAGFVGGNYYVAAVGVTAGTAV